MYVHVYIHVTHISATQTYNWKNINEAKYYGNLTLLTRGYEGEIRAKNQHTVIHTHILLYISI